MVSNAKWAVTPIGGTDGAPHQSRPAYMARRARKAVLLLDVGCVNWHWCTSTFQLMLTCVIPIASYHQPKGDCRERDSGASVPRARRRATVHCHHHRWASKLSRSTQDPDGVSPSALRKGGRCTPSVSFRIDCELPPLFMLTCTPMVYHVTALSTGRMVTLRQASFGNSMVCNAHHARTHTRTRIQLFV